jgi:4-amino-4-deoxy-L-arabinose transferase-like glycosyltransferase
MKSTTSLQPDIRISQRFLRHWLRFRVDDSNFVLAASLILSTGLISLLIRPLLPVDETRYISVAWEMWTQDSWWLPTRNFQPYSHKPPLLFWLIHLGWAVFGVNEWWPRLLNPMLGVGNLWLMVGLARSLWPERPRVAGYAPLVYVASWATLVFTTTLMFDTLMTTCVLLAALGLVKADRGLRGGWTSFTCGLALGLLTKGPVVLVYTLPVALAHRSWGTRPSGRWFAFVASSLILASLPTWIWVYKVAQATGAEHLRELLVEQTMARVHGDLGHGRPLWWYLPWLPLIGAPWSFRWKLWRDGRRVLKSSKTDPGLRFVAIAVVCGTLALSLVGGKQVHYLLPIWALAAPGVAFLSRCSSVHELDLVVPQRPSTPQAVAITSVGLFVALLVGAFVVLRPRYDIEQAARIVKQAQDAKRSVAFVGNYHAEFGFLGRLTEPIVALEAVQVDEWVRRNPNGVVIGRRKRLEASGGSIVFRQSYRSDELLVVDCRGWATPYEPSRRTVERRDVRTPKARSSLCPSPSVSCE